MASTAVDIERVIAWLVTSRFCSGLDAEAVTAIAGQVQVRPFTAGETLASAGDAVTEFWIVAEGEIGQDEMIFAQRWHFCRRPYELAAAPPGRSNHAAEPHNGA